MRIRRLGGGETWAGGVSHFSHDPCYCAHVLIITVNIETIIYFQLLSNILCKLFKYAFKLCPLCYLYLFWYVLGIIDKLYLTTVINVTTFLTCCSWLQYYYLTSDPSRLRPGANYWLSDSNQTSQKHPLGQSKYS